MTSMASSIQPSWAAIRVRHCSRVISRCHCIGLIKVTDKPVNQLHEWKMTAGPAGCQAFTLPPPRAIPLVLGSSNLFRARNGTLAAVTFQAPTAPTCCHLMAMNPLHTYFGRLLAAWLAVAGLMAAEHHGTVKSGGLPSPARALPRSKATRNCTPPPMRTAAIPSPTSPTARGPSRSRCSVSPSSPTRSESPSTRPPRNGISSSSR